MRTPRLAPRLLFGIALLLAGAAGLAPTPAAAQSSKPIKIGFLAPLTGAAAQIGRDMENGFAMYMEEAGHQMAGRKVEVIVEDTAGNPGTAITKFRKFVESDRVDMVVGETFAHIGYALAPKADEYKMPTIFPVIAADDLTQRKPSKWVVRLGWTGSQPSHPFGEYAAKTLGYKKVAVFGTDYAFGYEVVGGFQRSFEEAGGQIIQKLWAPLGTSDLAPYLSQLKRDADAAFIIVVSNSALRFPAQYRDAGLLGRLPVIGGAVIADESVLPTFGDEALGMVTPLMYSAALDTPANRKLRGRVSQEVRQGAVLLLRDLLHERPMDRGGGEGGGRPRGGPREVHGRLPHRGDPRRPARTVEARSVGQPDPEHLRAEGRAEERGAAEHGDPHLPGHLPVLDLQAGGVPEAAGVQPRLPTLPVLLGARC